jgi:hypothetical protein
MAKMLLVSSVVCQFFLASAVQAQNKPWYYQPPVNPLQANITGVRKASGNTPATNVPVPSPNERLLSGPQRPGTQPLSPVGISPFTVR